jgi:FkbM family methyltransferase
MLRFLHWVKMEQRFFQKRLHNGTMLYVSPQEHIQRQLFWYGYYEKKYVLTWERFVSEDAVVFDIGANIGYYSIIAAKQATTGVIYSFEPYSDSFSLLQRNIAFNKLSNIIPVQAAISNENGEKKLFITGSDNTGMTGLTKAENFSGRIETVQAISLDEWIKKTRLKRITIIKMDIEGSEYNALKGMEGLLQKCKPVLFIEISNSLLKSYGVDNTDIYKLLASHNYKAYSISEKQVLKPIYAPVEDNLVVFLPNGFLAPDSIRVMA